MQIFLLRHVDAQPLEEVETDEERSITLKGKKKIAKCGRGFRRLSLFPQRILASPLKRAIQTAEGIAEELTFSGHVEPVEELSPDASPEDLIEALKGLEAAQLLLVGHQPLLGAIAATLIGIGAEGRIGIKKGGAVRVDVDNWNQDPPGRLRLLVTAKQLGWMGKKKKKVKEEGVL